MRNKKIISVTLDAEVLKRFDAKIGLIPRSRAIEQLIREKLKMEASEYVGNSETEHRT